MPGPIERAREDLRAGRPDAAAARLERLLGREPRNADGLHLLGCAELQRGNAGEAVRRMEQAIAIAPGTALVHENLAEALWRAGSAERAERECAVALALDPAAHRPHNLLGLIALKRCDYAAALGHLRDALEARRPYPDAMANLAMVCNRTGDFDRARRYCEIALGQDPAHAAARINLGLALRGLGRLAEARAAFESAGAHPMARFNLGYAWLLEDDLARGLPLCEARKELLGLGRDLRRPEWDGTPMPGGILLVIHEQGLGDTILMSRFYPGLLERAGRVIVLVQKPLERLIATLSSELRVITDLGDTEYDAWCPTMSLPHRLGIGAIESVPRSPWLLPSAAAREPGPLRAGINWAGNPLFAHDFVRSTHLETLAPLLEAPGVEWCSLHKGHLEHEAYAFGLPQPLRTAADLLDT
ncbi:MAG TPA: tetratricopeptide repeat protein, partial [Terriglobales bacterium]|nr:tetratricopeptide repeat protein [Terriglobales bacterium]